MLELTNVTKTSGARTLLNAVSLTVEPGELVAVLGPTGSGKTTLLRLLMGLDAPDAGDIRRGDQLLSHDGAIRVPAEARGFSMVFEKTALLPFLDVAGNITLGCDDDRDLEPMIDLLGLHDLMDRQVHTLSGGEQQRVALARSLLVEPDLLLLDEPFRNIDRPAQVELLPAVVAFLRERGTTTILVTHDRDIAFSFSERMFLLRDGALVRDETPEALYAQPRGSWEARILGDANILPAPVARALGFESSGDGDVVVRPEQIEVSSSPPHNATLADNRFFGFYRILSFQVQEHIVMAKVLGDDDYGTQQSYRLSLRRGIELSRESDQ